MVTPLEVYNKLHNESERERVRIIDEFLPQLGKEWQQIKRIERVDQNILRIEGNLIPFVVGHIYSSEDDPEIINYCLGIAPDQRYILLLSQEEITWDDCGRYFHPTEHWAKNAGTS